MTIDCWLEAKPQFTPGSTVAVDNHTTGYVVPAGTNPRFQQFTMNGVYTADGPTFVSVRCSPFAGTTEPLGVEAHAALSVLQVATSTEVL